VLKPKFFVTKKPVRFLEGSLESSIELENMAFYENAQTEAIQSFGGFLKGTGYLAFIINFLAKTLL